jgi:hypothetical protein
MKDSHERHYVNEHHMVGPHTNQRRRFYRPVGHMTSQENLATITI